MRNAFSDALVAAAMADPKVLLLTGDHGYALFDAFRKACPNQYINCGVAEQNMVGVAAGLAKAGFKPVVYGLAAFVPVRVLEQIKIDICYEKLPVILIGDGAGLVYSHLGTSHQSTEDIACTRAIPDLTVLSPADRFEMSACMRYAFKINAPVYLRMGKSDCGDVHSSMPNLNEGEMLQIIGGIRRTAVLATGSMVSLAIQIVRDGLDAEIWSLPSIKPMSQTQVLSLASRVDYLITLEEHSVFGGMGSAVAEIIAGKTSVRYRAIGISDRFSEHCGNWPYLIEEHQIDKKAVSKRVNEFLTDQK